MKILIAFFILFSFSCSESFLHESNLEEESFTTHTSGKADSLGLAKPEIRAILEVVNTYSRYQMMREVGWFWLPSNHLIRKRNGEDGVRGTSDDFLFRNLSELDEVAYVGPKTFGRLRNYVHDLGLIEEHSHHFVSTLPDRIDLSKGLAWSAPIGPKASLHLSLVAEKGDRVRFWLRKANQTQWNPKVIISQSGTRVVSANPWGNADVRLPEGKEYEEGLLFSSSSKAYDIELRNTSKISGDLEFIIECVSGPCYDRAIGGRDAPMAQEMGELKNEELLSYLAFEHERNHHVQSYLHARQFMFGELDNFGGSVQCVYTATMVQTTKIPSNLEMNAEHTWPQSRGAKFGTARSDLHHLYPVTSYSNSMRSTLPFCEVDEEIQRIGKSKLGYDSGGEKCFEPPDFHKGSVARSMFYFSAAYGEPIDSDQERILRGWNTHFPVTHEERIRSTEITAFQGSKNYFVLNSDLVDAIADF